MRKFLPSEDYRLFKNRKSARVCRLKRKRERGKMYNELEQLTEQLKTAKIQFDDANLFWN